MNIKAKMILIVCIMFFMLSYMVIFGSKNAVIGLVIALAGLMNIKNDLSYKPALSFVKVWALLLILGIAAYLNNPINVFGCILMFFVVFGTTFTSYNLFGINVYVPYLLCYFMMMCSAVSLEDLHMRLLSLTIGAVFIVGLNVIVNRKKDYKLSKLTIDNLVNEIISAVDVKLDDGEVSKESFKTANGFYSTIFSNFEYKYFPSPDHEAVLNIVKAFQCIGVIIADSNLTDDELTHIKKVANNILNIDASQIYDGVTVTSKEMYPALLNFEIIVDEIKNSGLEKNQSKTDFDKIKERMWPVIKREFSLKSPKFVFALKMAFLLALWEILSLMFNLPYSKWLYFSTIPLLLPYVDDAADNTKSRLAGTVLGVGVFAVVLIAFPYIPLDSQTMVGLMFMICMLGMILKMEDTFKRTIFTTIMSVMASLMYISPSMALPLKILWILIPIVVVNLVNFAFLPYSVEKETKNNLSFLYELNGDFVELLREKCLNRDTSRKGALLAVSNIIGENVEITHQNKELFILQATIIEICNFILNYMDVNEFSQDVKDEMVNIIDGGNCAFGDYEINEKVILNSTQYVCDLFKKEQNLI